MLGEQKFPRRQFEMKAESRRGREKFDVAALAAKFFSCGLNDKIKPQKLGVEILLESANDAYF